MHADPRGRHHGEAGDAVGTDPVGAVRLTQQGAVVGTPLYMSPEQIEGTEPSDPRVDIWAMGAILYEALAGAPPFMDRSYARLVMSICQRDPPDLRVRNPRTNMTATVHVSVGGRPQVLQ